MVLYNLYCYTVIVSYTIIITSLKFERFFVSKIDSPRRLKFPAPHLLWPATWYPKDLLLTSPLPKSWMDYDEADLGSQKSHDMNPFGGFLKWWYPTTMGFPTKNDHFGVFWGYHHLRKPPFGPWVHWCFFITINHNLKEFLDQVEVTHIDTVLYATGIQANQILSRIIES